jgi:hypothetical protein
MMSEKIIIKNDTISTYLNTDDGLIGFTKAVDNGQTRLALQVLVEVIEQLVDRVSFLESFIEEDSAEEDIPSAQEEIVIEQKDSIQKSKTTSTAPDEAPANSSMIEEKKK